MQVGSSQDRSEGFSEPHRYLLDSDWARSETPWCGVLAIMEGHREHFALANMPLVLYA